MVEMSKNEMCWKIIKNEVLTLTTILSALPAEYMDSLSEFLRYVKASLWCAKYLHEIEAAGTGN